MKQKKTKRVLSFLVAFVLLLCCSLVLSAEAPEANKVIHKHDQGNYDCCGGISNTRGYCSSCNIGGLSLLCRGNVRANRFETHRRLNGETCNMTYYVTEVDEVCSNCPAISQTYTNSLCYIVHYGCGYVDPSWCIQHWY